MRYIVLFLCLIFAGSTIGFMSVFMAHLVNTEIIDSYFEYVMAYQVIISMVFLSSILSMCVMSMLIDKKIVRGR